MPGEWDGKPAEEPATIGRYRIVAHLTGDAIDEVYRGFDPMIERPVVVKVFRLHLPDPGSESAVKQTFYRQMQRAGALVHHGIAALFDAGEQPGALFMASELVEGVSLAEWLTGGVDLELAMRVSLVAQMVEALECARESGMPHLNLKPTNIVVSPDYTVKIGGFGVAPVVDAIVAASGLPAPRASWYAGPERARGEPGDHRSDVFSLARIALDVLASPGAAPHTEATPELPAYLASHGVAADRWVGLFARACAPDPAARFETAEALKLELLLTLGMAESEARLAWDTSRTRGAMTALEPAETDFETVFASRSETTVSRPHDLSTTILPAPEANDATDANDSSEALDDNDAQTILGPPGAPRHSPKPPKG